MITESAIRTAIAAVITAADNSAQVHKRFRYPKEARLEEFAKLFREGGNPKGKINGYMLRRVRRTPVMKGIPGRLVQVTHVYKIRYYAHLVDSDDPMTASEEIAQAKIEALAAALESHVTLGLGNAVSHEGLSMEMDFTDVYLGDTAVHRNDLGISVTVANVNC